MTETQAFDTDVVAYPAITLIERGRTTQPTMVAENPAISPPMLAELAGALRGQVDLPYVRIVPNAVQGSSPWLLTSGTKLDIIRRLEAKLPTLEEVGCKVGIGVATGADRAFIAPFDELDVEPSRKLPLVTTKDLASGHVVWKGLGVINPFEDDGTLVDLARYPKFAKHLDTHRDAISQRHVAKKAPDRWYRTIDRITPSLAAVPKLLIPDIKGEAQVAYDAGHLYPHHNLYFVTSTDWNLHALQAVLLSCVTREFIRSYSTAMRGGFLRFQAQYLRRIRIPRWADVSEELRASLIRAAEVLDLSECNAAAAKLYKLSDEEMRELKG
ncbi:TaqI-like C-terminal specificity domain-containing protein [Curvibacter lanceolatus]|uniref:TaqI-like C-terminal specificity domain-containing protein n=1 Tax=Curvibacter lanceolatus TaxID=86182 RepID=UPI001FDF2B1F|nr:TaqI-like C-terminal specificity domain-containing protein [Curvibacter lanceolatus]